MPLYPGFPLGGSDYTIGTITLTAGSKDFTLTGSNPLDYAAAQAGDEIYVPHAAKVLLIETITNTGGTLIYPCPADCAGAALPFRLQLKNASSRLQGMAATLLQAIGSGNLAALDELTLQDGQLIAGDATQGKLKAINVSDLQTSLPALLTAIGALDLGEDKLIAGGATAGSVKAVDFPALLTAIGALDLGEDKLIAGGATAGSVKAIDLPAPVDITGKLDKYGGEVTGDIIRTGSQMGSFKVTIPDGEQDGGGLILNPQSGGQTVTISYIGNAGNGGVRIRIGGSIVAGFWPNGVAQFSNAVYAGDAYLHPTGNIYGSAWENWHSSGWATTAIDARIDAKIAASTGGGTTFHTIEMLNSGEIDWPDWVEDGTPVYVMAWAGGGGGGWGGGECVVGWFKRSDFVNNTVVIGAGGTKSFGGATAGWGGNTLVGGIITAYGGHGAYGNGYDQNPHRGGNGGGATGGKTWHSVEGVKDSTYGGGGGGGSQWLNGQRHFMAGSSVYGGGGGIGGSHDGDPNLTPGWSVFGGNGGGRGQDGQIPGGGGGSQPNTSQQAGNGAQGKVVLKIWK